MAQVFADCWQEKGEEFLSGLPGYMKGIQVFGWMGYGTRRDSMGVEEKLVTICEGRVVWW